MLIINSNNGDDDDDKKWQEKYNDVNNDYDINSNYKNMTSISIIFTWLTRPGLRMDLYRAASSW